MHLIKIWVRPISNNYQVYFVGNSQAQIDIRTWAYRGSRPDLIRVFQSFLNDNNDLIRLFKTALERMPTDQSNIIIRGDKVPQGEHAGRYNAPVVDETAILIVGDDPAPRDIIIQRRDGRPKRIDELHASYDALQYPLIFWRGQDTYNFNMMQYDRANRRYFDRQNPREKSKKLSAMSYYCHQFMVREQSSDNFIFRCGQLLNQFIVDAYAKIESGRLRFIKLNQNQLRVESYIYLRDAVMADQDVANIGQRVILPWKFLGGPRNLHEYSQDALTYVKLFGRPDLFITFTCNPKWPELIEIIPENQNSYDRHDLTARLRSKPKRAPRARAKNQN